MSDIPPDDNSADDDLVIDNSKPDDLVPEPPVSENAVTEPPPGKEPEGDSRANSYHLAAFLMSHYRDTYGIVLRHGKARDRLFLYILIMLSLMAVDGLSRGTLSKVINGYVETHLVGDAEEWEKLDFTGIIHLLVNFCLLSLVLRYYQRTMLTCRTYNYLIRLEEYLCKALDGPYITRHGEAYLSRKGAPEEKRKKNQKKKEKEKEKKKKKERPPVFLRFVRLVYDGIFPVALAALAVWMFFSYLPAFTTLWQTATYDPATLKSTLSQIGSGICTLGIAFSSLLYLVWVVLRR